jgi:multiple sugar transport system ATP-binding protein
VTKIYANDVRAVNNLTLDIGDGEFTVLVGPSGCGKSTLLRMIAGLEKVDGGTIRIGGRDVTHLTPQQRDLAMVFQSYALYPHMTVRENCAFALKQRNVPRKEIDQRVESVASMLSLDGLLDRRPAALSGGQRQRVAMGRAMVRDPHAFLMDEPLSNLDAQLRVRMRSQLVLMRRRVQTTTVYVTHDQVEAMTLGDRVAVLRDGVLHQYDTPQRLYSAPRNLFVAEFIGSPQMSLVEASLGDGQARFADISIPLTEAQRALGTRTAILGIRPSDLTLPQPNDPRPHLRVRIDGVEELGSERNLIFKVDAPPVVTDAVRAAQATTSDDDATLLDDQHAQFIAVVPGRSGPKAGDLIDLVVDPETVHFFDPTTGEALIRDGYPTVDRTSPSRATPASA